MVKEGEGRLKHKRVAFIHGPGDAYGTYAHWRRGREDPSIPKKTYSGQFYDLARDTGLQALVICETGGDASHHDWLHFKRIAKNHNYSGRLGYFRNEYAYFRKIRRALIEFEADAVIFTSYLHGIFAGMMPRDMDVVLALHNTYWQPFSTPKGLKKQISLALLRRSFNRAFGAVCVSPEMERQIKALVPRPDFETRVQVPSVMRLPFDPRPRDRVRNLLFVGRITAEKGVFDLVNAFEQLATKHPDLHLAYVGGGAAFEPLRDHVNQRFPDRVSLLGPSDSAEVIEHYLKADLVICPTTTRFNEGLATVPIEAAVYGAPTLNSSVVPAREYFDHADLVFRADDAADLALKISALVNDPDRYKLALAATVAGLRKIESSTMSWYQAMGSILGYQLNPDIV